MVGSRFMARPVTERKPFEIFGRSEWLDLKLELSIGDKRGIDVGGFKSMVAQADRPDGDQSPRETEIKVDWVAQNFRKIHAWVADWSLADDDGIKLPLTLTTIGGLNEATYDAIDGIVTAWAEARDREKKVTSGASALATTSP